MDIHNDTRIDRIIADGKNPELMTGGEIKYYNYIAHLADMMFREDFMSALRMTPDTLVALVENGPLEDGDVPSKSERDMLIKAELANRVIVKGQDGFTAATYKAASVYRYHFGKSDTIAEAKAFRQAKRAVTSASQK